MAKQCGHLDFVHFHATQHPIMTSIEPGENWSWCYVDELAMELLP